MSALGSEGHCTCCFKRLTCISCLQHVVGGNIKANCKKTQRSFNEQKVNKLKPCSDGNNSVSEIRKKKEEVKRT